MTCVFWCFLELLTYQLVVLQMLGEYISQSTWASRQDFKNWTQSQNVSSMPDTCDLLASCVRLLVWEAKHCDDLQFVKAHGKSEGAQGEKPKESKRAGMAELLDGPPKPRMYEAVTVTEV